MKAKPDNLEAPNIRIGTNGSVHIDPAEIISSETGKREIDRSRELVKRLKSQHRWHGVEMTIGNRK
ncbi:MAG: hypothetical protein ACPGU7_12990 [Gammaproteobacteria bacterium]